MKVSSIQPLWQRPVQYPPFKMQETRLGCFQNVPCAHLKPLVLVNALNQSSMDGFCQGSPWDHYVALGEPVLDGDVDLTKARLKGPRSIFVTIQSTTLTPAVRERLSVIWTLKHDNIHAIREAFIYDGKIYVVFESFQMSLGDIAGHSTLTEACLATVLAQVRMLRPC